MLRPVPLTRDLVLVGGGHAHALVLRAWGMDPLPGARLTVINPGPTAPYTGMLPGHVAGHYKRDELEIDLVRLCRHAGARFIDDRATGIDRTARLISIEGRGPVAYDVASIDIGIHAGMEIPGFAEYGIGAKPLDRFAARWRDFVDAVTRGNAAPEIAVIGGGVAGCELAMAMAFRLRAAGRDPRVTVIERDARISGMGDRARRVVRDRMAALGVEMRTGAEVAEITPEAITLAGGEIVQAALCVGAAGAFPHDWIVRSDLPQQDGFIEVGPDLGVTGDDRLFAVGDCAVMPHAPRPKAGVFAVRAAPVLAENLRAALTGGARRHWRPQKNYLKLISLGEKSALAEKYGLTLSGPRMWQWKDRIDRAFMDRLGDLPVMSGPQVPQAAAGGVREMLEAKPLCGGCGAKVGQGILAGALQTVGGVGGDVVTSAGDDAAVLRRPGGGFQVVSTDHLRAMVADPVTMARIAAIHALGDIWAMAAAPQVALASLILPEMSADLQRRTLREITDAAEAVISGAGARLVGGHTTMGAELTIGFTVTGTRDEMPLTVAGARPGDVLILTRPVGSGVILAADMQGKAAGRDVMAMLAIMGRPQDREAEILGRVARAMTDVTGFGLAGHVAAICRASGVDAEINADAVPVYRGARALSGAGVSSSLAHANRADAAVSGRDDPLLFDPQTAGGLLAAVPPGQAEALCAELAGAEREGVVVGQCRAGAGKVRVT